MTGSDVWPEWWDWELEIAGHARDVMLDRFFNETDLRAMLADTTGLRNGRPGRWVADTHHDGRRWKVVLEPDFGKRVLVVITAFRVSY